MIGTGKTNWLLQGLIALSVGVHLVVLLALSERYHPLQPVLIELDLRTLAPPLQRDIPRPESAPVAGAFPDAGDDFDMPDEATPSLDFSPPPEVKNITPGPLPDPDRMPQLPDIKGVDIAAWNGRDEPSKPQPQPAVAAPVDHDASPGKDAYRIWEKVVQDLIDDKTQVYAKKARRRHLAGVTVVSVVVGLDGTLTATVVSESSGHRSLDQIALKAVKAASPFPQPPGGPVTLVIPIHFQGQ